MSERKDRPEHEQDRGTKAESGIGLDMQSSEVRRTPSTDFSSTMQ